MKYVFIILVGVTLFFALSAGKMTPAIVVNHDKVAHFVVFLMLSFCMTLSFPTHTIKQQIVIMVSFATGIEIIQYLFTNRELSVVDISASIAGVFFYLILLKIVGGKFKIVRGSS